MILRIREVNEFYWPRYCRLARKPYIKYEASVKPGRGQNFTLWLGFLGIGGKYLDGGKEDEGEVGGR